MTRFGTTGPELEPGDPHEGMGAVLWIVIAVIAFVAFSLGWCVGRL
jgi:hypothetical protein